VRLDHLLSKEQLARSSTRVASRAMSWASVPRWQLTVEHWLFGQARYSSQLVRPLGAGRVVAVRPGRARCWVLRERALSPPRTGAPRRVCGGVRVRDRPYLENCTVDASIICSCQVNKGTRWMPWHQEPKKDVGACDKPREVGNQTLIRGFPNRET
jgi:hypothetical protein